jgi:predicted phage-related endonuclease
MTAAFVLPSTRRVDAYVELCDSTDRGRWLAMRRSGIGASEAAIVVGEHSRHTLSRLVAEKRGLIGDDDETKEFLEWGLRLEPVMIEAYSSARYAGREAHRAGRLLRSAVYPWALATLDAWTLHPVHGWIPLELKSTDWARDAWELGTPPDFWWQAQWQALVTDAPMVSVACMLGPHKLVWEDVPRDEAAIRRLTIHGAEAWALIKSDRDPPGPYDRTTFHALWPNDDGTTIELDERFIRLDDEREELTAARKRADARIDEINAEILAEMRSATTAVVPNGRTTYSLKTVSRKAYSVAATSYRQLRRTEQKASK